MTKETKPHTEGTCIFCKLPVTRAYPDSPLRTGNGDWRCSSHPRASTSNLTWHEVK